MSFFHLEGNNVEQKARKGMKPLLIIKTGSALPELLESTGDFDDDILNQIPGLATYEVAPVFERLSLPGYDEISGVIITGSHAMVTDREEWSEFAAGWLRGIPVGSLSVPCRYWESAMGTSFWRMRWGEMSDIIRRAWKSAQSRSN